MGKQAGRGFSLVELLTGISIISTLLAFAVPGMSAWQARQRIAAARAELHAALMLARSSALDTQQRVVLCPSVDGHSCNTSREWARGYLLFVDLNADRKRQAREPVLRVFDSHARVSIVSSVGRPQVVFYPEGGSPGSNLTLTICALGHAQPASTLVLSNSGRLRSGTGASCSV